MPQLMPLNWVFSSIMVSLIVISAGVIYSENMLENEVNMSLSGMKSSMNYWCW
uniref:ATP synthase F0 subunit 8 n=1 Tax=Neoscona scylla TaxID=1112445 RepID=A0A4Y6I5U6_9ARAC|nr:ATP synthase F0 subunit 8 [Neoscona scylla]QDF64711.1 ATP synthase F0 subunit 8 [Neoscona scylla]